MNTQKKKRQSVLITKKSAGQLITELFRHNVPEGIIVRKNPRKITHYHSYGSLSRFFRALTKGELLGTRCIHCPQTEIWLPPRIHCPDCWNKMVWILINPYGAKVYSHSVTNLPGAGFKGTVPCPLISVEIPGVCTKPMSYLSKFGDREPYIGMPVRPVFRTKKPTYTILDVSWVPID